MGLLSTLAGATLAVVAYTLSTVSQTFWLSAPLSLYGQFLFFVAGISVVSFCMLVGLAVYFRDVRVLLTHHNRSGRRLFFCTLCKSASPDDETVAVNTGRQSCRDSCTLRWDRLSQTECMCLLGINNGLAGLMQFYATPPNRQPPLISSILSSLTVIAAIPLSKYALHDHKVFLSLQVGRRQSVVG
jgi:hypothetical protein